MKENAINWLLYKTPVFKDLHEYQRKKLSRVRGFFRFLSTFMFLKYLNNSHPQKLCPHKTYAVFQFLKKVYYTLIFWKLEYSVSYIEVIFNELHRNRFRWAFAKLSNLWRYTSPWLRVVGINFFVWMGLSVKLLLRKVFWILLIREWLHFLSTFIIKIL